MNLYDASNITAAPWPDTEWGRKARSFLVPLFQQGPQAFFEDKATPQLVAMDDLLIPLTITDADHGNSYYHSMYARYIASQRAALKTGNWSPLAGFAMDSALWGVGSVLKATQLDKAVQVDNWPSLRNMGSHLSADQVRRLTDFLVSRFPRHALIFPALNPNTHAPLLNDLRSQGYEVAFMTPTRMLLPAGIPLERKERENRRRDAKVLPASGYTMVDGKDMPGCAPRLAELYRMLNREKYTTNPPITPAYFEAALKGDMVHFRLAVKDGRIDMFYGVTVHDNVVFCVAAGYDLGVPQEVGLYRIINSLLMHEALDRGITIETGSGADQFKTLRGDRPMPRYNAVYYRHLPSYRHVAWKLVRRLANENIRPVARAHMQRVDGPDETLGFDNIPETFTSIIPSPAESVALLRAEMESLERAVTEAQEQGGIEQVRRTAEVTKALDEGDFPPQWVEALRERLNQTAKQNQQEKRARKTAERAERAELARKLLADASKLGDTTLVARHLGDAPAHHLRTMADLLRKAATPTAVVLTATQGGTVALVTAANAELIQRGVNAGELLAQVAPAVAGNGEGGPEVAWGQGSRPDGVDAAHEAVRQFLQGRLGNSSS